MAKLDPQVAAHLEWLGFVKPTGLVVSAPALVRAGVILNRRDVHGQRLLNDWARTCQAPQELTLDGANARETFCSFARQVLGWSFSSRGYAGTDEEFIGAELEVTLPESEGLFRPDFAVRAGPLAAAASSPDAAAASETDANGVQDSPWQLLVSVTDPGSGFDRHGSGGSELSVHARMERLLRHTRTPAGLLFNTDELRLLSAPVGESSGWLDFRIADMRQTSGRPICAAMRELLSETRLLTVPASKRLAALLNDSRKFQNEVSERLAQQVLHALYELLRGFQAAHDASGGALLHRLLREGPDEIYRGLLTVVLRLVFLLYAEERDMLPQDAVFLGSYSVSGLYERLREDAAMHPDTMDQRYGAYAQLLALWRMVHDGAKGPNIRLSPRHGDLFHPDRYPFLEARDSNGLARQSHERVNAPLVSDGTVHRVLEKLIVLDSERISYRALDIEHIGSVYETMMGFRLETATGRSVAVKAAGRHGAPAAVNIEEMLAEVPAKRSKWLQERTDRKLTPKVKKAVSAAGSAADNGIDELHAALDSVIDKNATPDLVPAGAMILQPSAERRRSGSHYTPRELTEPIVRTALEPVLDRLRSEADGPLRPEQILDLKVCDPAMGSGAFLVEACRQLADTLVEAWRAHGRPPMSALKPAGVLSRRGGGAGKHQEAILSTEEDETVYARRLVAQRCLYGVDRNPKAVDLAKLSLWLTTLAKDHPLTFLDHALRHGDSLVGLSIRQLEAFHWKGDAPVFEEGFEALEGRRHLAEAAELRQLIRQADESVTDGELRELWDRAQTATAAARILGDLVLAAFLDSDKPRARESRRREFAAEVLAGRADAYRQWLADRRNESDASPLAPFHWQIEFPEVFHRDNPGFDTIVGNPPFLGGNNITTIQGQNYSKWLRELHKESSGGADLVAHFFRRAYILIRKHGTFGFIATNTIYQGDTRASGLRYICSNGGEIYNARRRLKWPGLAAVVVSVVHVSRGPVSVTKYLDGNSVDKITAFLYHSGTHNDPTRLIDNSDKSFQGTILLGMGFTFDDSDSQGVASSLDRMDELVRQDPLNRQIIRPYIGGREININPTLSHHRYVINFGERSQIECESQWPELFKIVESKVKHERMAKDGSKYPRAVYEWWKFRAPCIKLYERIINMEYLLATSRVCTHIAIAKLPADMVYADSLILFPLSTFSCFSALQSRPHEIWARFFGSSLGDGLRYTPSDCFETFPFPMNWETSPDLETVGREYYEFRAALMVENDEGMTKTYNRFHDPYECHPQILKLREMHAAMDRAVLDAYGWEDVPTQCDFFLDYEIDEETWGNKKKPYRYRWPDDVRDSVLGRLLALNADCAAAEARAGRGGSECVRSRKPRRGQRQTAGQDPDPGTLFEGAP